MNKVVSGPLRKSLSTWAIHGWVDQSFWDAPDAPHLGFGVMDKLMHAPALMAERDILTLEVCHFHLPRYNSLPLVDAAKESEVQLFQLLIDEGDISNPESHERDLDWILGWLKVAGEMGFERARVVAGKTVGEGALSLAIDNMKLLCNFAESIGVRIVFENWHPLMATPANVIAMHEALEGRAGLCFDFGNWSGPTKYEDLAQIAPLAESCHAKCSYENGVPDLIDFDRCLQITREAGFEGPYSLVHGEPGQEWESLAPQLEMLDRYLPS